MAERSQNLQVPAELQQQVYLLNARINNANLANNDLLKEMENTFKALTATIVNLQKENTELKTKLTQTQEKPKPK